MTAQGKGHGRGPKRAHGLLAASLLAVTACLPMTAAPPAQAPGPTIMPAAPSAPPAAPAPVPTASPQPPAAPADTWPNVTVDAGENLLRESVFKPVFAQVSVKAGYCNLELDSRLTNGGKAMRQVLVYAASPIEATGWFHVLTEGQRLRIPVPDGQLYVGLVDHAAADNDGTATVTVLDDQSLPIGLAVVDGRRHVVGPQTFRAAQVAAPAGYYTVDVDAGLDYGPEGGRVVKLLLVAQESLDATGWYATPVVGLGSRIQIPATALYATALSPDSGVTGRARLTFR